MRLTPFQFYVQKILPLAMDDSLSYYETLLKIRNKLNDVITAQNSLLDNFESVEQALTEIQEYVEEYFETLDLTAETREILREMVDSGQFSEIATHILATYFNPVFVNSTTEMQFTAGCWTMETDGVNNVYWYLDGSLYNSKLVFKGYVNTTADLPESPETGRDAYVVTADNNLYVFDGVQNTWVNQELFYNGQIASPAEAIHAYAIYVLKSNSHVYAFDTQTQAYVDTGIVYSVSNSSFIYRRQITADDTPRTINLAGWYFYLFLDNMPDSFPDVTGKTGFVLCFDSIPNNYLLLVSITGECFFWNGTEWIQFPATDTTLSKSGVAADAKATGDAVNELETEISQEQQAREETDGILTKRLDAIYDYGLTVYSISLLTQRGNTIVSEDSREIQGSYYSLKQDYDLVSSVLPANGKATGDAVREETAERIIADNSLAGLISDETTRAQNAERDLQSAITSEETARINKDSLIDVAITGETRMRQIEIRETRDLIDSETLARETADASIIDTLDSFKNLFPVKSYSIDAVNGDGITTQNNLELTAELIGVYQTTDKTLTAENEAADAKATGDAVREETAERIIADNSLAGLIDSETARAQNAESELQTDKFIFANAKGEIVLTGNQSCLYTDNIEKLNKAIILTDNYSCLITSGTSNALFETADKKLSNKIKKFIPVNTTITAFGDSITAGVGGAGYSATGGVIYGTWKRNDAGTCWANLLRDYFPAVYNSTFVNNGVSGLKLWEIANMNVLKGVLGNCPEYALFSFGINDLKFASYTFLDPPNSETFITSCFYTVTGFCAANGITPIFTSTYLFGGNYITSTQQHITPGVWNYLLKRVCDKNKIKFIDVATPWAQYNITAGHFNTQSDDLHPNTSGHKLLFNIYLSALNLIPAAPPVFVN